MRNNMWTKTLVIGIIMLFVGTSIVPAITGNSRHLNETFGQDIKTMDTSGASLVVNPDSTLKDLSLRPEALTTNHVVTKEIRRHTSNGNLPLPFTTASISQPLNNDIFRAGDIVDIQGTANGSTFQYYTVEWGLGENPSTWSSTGITLVNGGLVGVVNGSLATWDTSFVTNGDFYSLRLMVNLTTSQNETRVTDIYIDPTLKEGWPQRIPYEYNSQGGYYYWAGFLEPVVDDINNDGYSEIIVYKGGNPPKLFAFSDGVLFCGQPPLETPRHPVGTCTSRLSVISITTDSMRSSCSDTC